MTSSDGSSSGGSTPAVNMDGVGDSLENLLEVFEMKSLQLRWRKILKVILFSLQKL